MFILLTKVDLSLMLDIQEGSCECQTERIEYRQTVEVLHTDVTY